jgi:alpha-glucosidase
LITLRTSLEVLHTGGLRWLYVQDDAIAFVRELPQQRALFIVARCQRAPVRIPIADLQADSPRRVFGFEGVVESSDLVIQVKEAGASIWILE